MNLYINVCVQNKIDFVYEYDDCIEHEKVSVCNAEVIKSVYEIEKGW